MCACSPEFNKHLSHPVGPKGICMDCGTEGPFHQQAVIEAIASGHDFGRDYYPGPEISRYQRIDWEIAFKEEDEDVSWIRPGFLEAGTLTALFSAPGVGKSLLSLQVALEAVREGFTVTYVDDENRTADIVGRLRSSGASWRELDHLIVYNFQNLPPLDTDEGGEHLEALAEADRPDLVILDTISRMVAGDENAADTYLQLYRCTLTRLKRKKIAVLRLDHSGKDTTRGQRGTSAKESDLDVLWSLERSGDDAFTLECRKSRSGHIPHGTLVAITREYEPLRHTWDVQIDMNPAKYAFAVRQMDNVHLPVTAGIEGARKALRDAGIGGFLRTDILHAAIVARRNRQEKRKNMYGYQCPF